jgi:hypothetical protein
MLSVFMLSCIKAECLYYELPIQPVALFCYAECLYAEFPIQTVAFFVLLIVIMLNVVAPSKPPSRYKAEEKSKKIGLLV